jgi:hypothetical protein
VVVVVVVVVMGSLWPELAAARSGPSARNSGSRAGSGSSVRAIVPILQLLLDDH